MRAFGAGLAACSAAAVVAQAQAVAVQQAQQQGSGLAAGLAALGYGGSPLGALGSPAQLQNTGISSAIVLDPPLPSPRAPLFSVNSLFSRKTALSQFLKPANLFSGKKSFISVFLKT